MTRASVETRYPFVTVDYEDEALPVSFQLEAFTPFAALDVEQSSLPLAVFTVAARNNGPATYDVRLAATVQNAVGWDGSTPIDGTRCALYGGNRNHVERDERRVAVVLGNPTLAAEHPRSGELALAALTPEAAAFPRWQTTDAFMAFLGRAELDLHGGRGRGLVTPDDVPSPAGETWNAGLVVPLRLEPGEEATACFALAWWFPNRVVNWLNFGPRRVLDEHYPLGNAYTAPFGGALGVVDHVASRLEALRERSAEWADLFSDTSLPDTLAEGMAPRRQPSARPSVSGPATAASSASRAEMVPRPSRTAAGLAGRARSTAPMSGTTSRACRGSSPSSSARCGRRSSDMFRRRRDTSLTASCSRSTCRSSGTRRSAARTNPALDGMLGAC